MEGSTYQELAARTMNTQPVELTHNDFMIVWNAIGLSDEAGEVLGLVKKGILHQHGLDRAAMLKELGDCLWYLAGLCTVLGVDLDDVMQANIDKLKARYPDGFAVEDSIKRVDLSGGGVDG